MLWFQNKQVKQKNSQEGLQQNGFFVSNLCFAKCEKLSFLGALFWQILVDVQKHYILV